MEYTLLGRTGVRVSRLALGTATFGVAPQEKDAIKLVHRALDLGINFFDTAVTYGNQPRFDRPGAPPAHQRKSAEEILGMALQLPALKSIGDSIGMDFSSAITPPSDPQAGTPTKRSTK